MFPHLCFALLVAFPAVVLAPSADAPKPSASGPMDRFASAPAACRASAGSECVKLARSEPFQPDESPLPRYPDEARTARVEGDVSFHLVVGSGCAPEEITIDDGPKLLRDPVTNAVKDWKFCGVPEGQEIHAAIAFRLNCPG